MHIEENAGIGESICLVANQRLRILMDKRIKTRGMAGFIVRITGGHFLTYQRSAVVFVIFLKFSVKLLKQGGIVPVIISVYIVDIAVVDFPKEFLSKFFLVSSVVGIETYG